MAGLQEAIQTRGLFCSLYSDRGSHFFYTPKAGEKVDKSRPTQVGQALKELGIQMIAAYSPEARGRMERSYGTWQGRLPQELRLAGITTVEAANRFLRDSYIQEFNRKFTVPAAGRARRFASAGAAIWTGCFRSKPSAWWRRTTPWRSVTSGGKSRNAVGGIRWPARP